MAMAATTAATAAVAAAAAQGARDTTRLELLVCFVYILFYFITLMFILGPLKAYGDRSSSITTIDYHNYLNLHHYDDNHGNGCPPQSPHTRMTNGGLETQF
jgi:hypothetical protein